MNTRLFERKWTLKQLTLWSILFVLPWLAVIAGFYIFHSYMAAFLLYSLGCCLLPLLFFSRFSLPEINTTKNRYVVLTFSILVTYGLVYLIWPLLEPYLVSSAIFSERLNEVHLLSQLDFWILAIYMTAFNPVIEEMFWRGYVYEEFKTKMSITAALWLSSFFFGLWHYVIIHHFIAELWQVPVTIGVMLAGVVFGWLYEKYGIGEAVIFHGLAADAPCMWVLYVVMSKTVWSG